MAGIFIAGAVNSNTHAFYNSISNTGVRTGPATQVGSFGIAVTGSNPVVELKDNIFYNTQTTSVAATNGKTYAIGMETSVFTNFSSNFNDFFTSGANAAGFRTGGIEYGRRRNRHCDACAMEDGNPAGFRFFRGRPALRQSADRSALAVWIDHEGCRRGHYGDG